jgi:DNA invertase Pin-like site-specific DNA recombinase
MDCLGESPAVMFSAMSLTEEVHAAAARRLADAAQRLRDAEAEVRAAALHAKAVGMSVNRSATVAETSRTTVYRWIREAETADQPEQETSADADAG